VADSSWAGSAGAEARAAARRARRGWASALIPLTEPPHRGPWRSSGSAAGSAPSGHVCEPPASLARIPSAHGQAPRRPSPRRHLALADPTLPRLAEAFGSAARFPTPASAAHPARTSERVVTNVSHSTQDPHHVPRRPYRLVRHGGSSPDRSLEKSPTIKAIRDKAAITRAFVAVWRGQGRNRAVCDVCGLVDRRSDIQARNRRRQTPDRSVGIRGHDRLRL
jgi:hypothetical protein